MGQIYFWNAQFKRRMHCL